MAEIITNNTEYFKKFRGMLEGLFNLNEDEILSDMREASLDDSDKNSLFYLYNNRNNLLNMSIVKLDDLTKYFLSYMKDKHGLNNFEQTQAVDAICIDRNNEWFFIEFKNRKYSDNISDIKKKGFKSLWLVSMMNSVAQTDLFGDNDFTDFARRHITYIMVVSREKNLNEYQRIKQSNKNLYTPNEFKKYIGYYYKDVYMFTEHELCKFIKNFNA